MQICQLHGDKKNAKNRKAEKIEISFTARKYINTQAADTRSRSCIYMRTCTIYAIAPYHNHSRAQTNEFIFTSVDFYLWVITIYIVHVYISHDHVKPNRIRIVFYLYHVLESSKRPITLRNWYGIFLNFSRAEVDDDSVFLDIYRRSNYRFSLANILIAQYFFFLLIATYNYT